MNRTVKYCLFFLLNLCAAYAAYAQDIEQKLKLALSTGRQQENFNWSIAGNSSGQSPNILSELKWKNVSGQNYAASVQWNLWRRFSIFADYNRTSVTSGSVSDMDYSMDNRMAPTYSETFSDNKGYTDGWSLGAGYVIFNKPVFSLVPYIGYGNNAQYLYIVDLTGRFPGLNSSYHTQWKGPLIKVISSVKIIHALKFAAAITYYQAKYSALGDWNLINEFQHPVSYHHSADGYGISTNGKLIYNLTGNIAVNIGYSYYDWQTGTGFDQLYLASGHVDKTRLNGVFRKGYQVGGGVVLSL